MINRDHLMSHTARVVLAFIGNNALQAHELPELIATVHASLSGVDRPPAQAEPASKLIPAVPISKSVTYDYIISLEDGRRFKLMKRYLGLLGMTPADYRAKWGLPGDYPMAAPGYATKRSELAKAIGLGRKAEAPVPVVTNVDRSEIKKAVEAEPATGPKRQAGRPKEMATDPMGSAMAETPAKVAAPEKVAPEFVEAPIRHNGPRAEAGHAETARAKAEALFKRQPLIDGAADNLRALTTAEAAKTVKLRALRLAREGTSTEGAPSSSRSMRSPRKRKSVPNRPGA